MVPVHEGRVNDHPLAAVEERSQLVHPSPLPMVPIISYNSQHSIDLSDTLKKYINKYISQVNYVPTCYRNKKSAAYAHTHIHSNKENLCHCRERSSCPGTMPPSPTSCLSHTQTKVRRLSARSKVNPSLTWTESFSAAFLSSPRLLVFFFFTL